jgi:hypothetical protein
MKCKLLILGRVIILEIRVITRGTACCIQTYLLASEYPERIYNFSTWNDVYQKTMNGFVNFVFTPRGCDTVGTVMWSSLSKIFRLHRKLINKDSVPSAVFCNTTKLRHSMPVRRVTNNNYNKFPHDTSRLQHFNIIPMHCISANVHTSSAAVHWTEWLTEMQGNLKLLHPGSGGNLNPSTIEG